jgi:hypothetical protein
VKKVRKLPGMQVSEISGATQRDVFERLARFSVGRIIESVHIPYLPDEEGEFAVVVWC